MTKYLCSNCDNVFEVNGRVTACLSCGSKDISEVDDDIDYDSGSGSLLDRLDEYEDFQDYDSESDEEEDDDFDVGHSLVDSLDDEDVDYDDIEAVFSSLK